MALAAADHAFKTPTLRELAWTRAYMHDGSMATLEDVVRYYEKGGVARLTRSRDRYRRTCGSSDGERADLIAFLADPLYSDQPRRSLHRSPGSAMCAPLPCRRPPIRGGFLRSTRSLPRASPQSRRRR